MPKFRKKPVVIEAEQYRPGLLEPEGLCFTLYGGVHGDRIPHVHTIHANQTVAVEFGDWIIPEPDGIHLLPLQA